MLHPVGTRGVVVGQVVKVRPHVDGLHIWLADVDIGADYQPQIIWGGLKIVRAGSLVPVAPPGAWLPLVGDKPGPRKIRRRRYRGEVSEGMLCSLAELGWDASVADQVTLLDGSAGLYPGQSLDHIGADWRSIVIPATRPAGAYQPRFLLNAALRIKRSVKLRIPASVPYRREAYLSAEDATGRTWLDSMRRYASALTRVR